MAVMENTHMKYTLRLTWLIWALTPVALYGAELAQQWKVFESSFETTRRYANPYTNIEVNVVFRQAKRQWTVPAFWAGEGTWKVRFAPPIQGEYRFRVQCSDPTNPDLNGIERSLTVAAYSGTNPLIQHGFLKVSANGRHFEHADGTPFLWLGDTWWKALAKRLTWGGGRQVSPRHRSLPASAHLSHRRRTPGQARGRGVGGLRHGGR